MGFLVQVLHGILDPLLLGVSTDLLGQYGPEAVGEEDTVRWSSIEVSAQEGSWPLLPQDAT